MRNGNLCVSQTCKMGNKTKSGLRMLILEQKRFGDKRVRGEAKVLGKSEIWCKILPCFVQDLARRKKEKG